MPVSKFDRKENKVVFIIGSFLFCIALALIIGSSFVQEIEPTKRLEVITMFVSGLFILLFGTSILYGSIESIIENSRRKK